jgi:hypothetical protein
MMMQFHNAFCPFTYLIWAELEFAASQDTIVKYSKGLHKPPDLASARLCIPWKLINVPIGALFCCVLSSGELLATIKTLNFYHI